MRISDWSLDVCSSDLKADASTYAATGFARDILSIADNLTRAIAAIPEAARDNDVVKSVVTGVEMTAKELESVFQRHGIARTESIGQKPDPHRNQAMMAIEHDEEPGTIVRELQAGYMMTERQLRQARSEERRVGKGGGSQGGP